MATKTRNALVGALTTLVVLGVAAILGFSINETRDVRIDLKTHSDRSWHSPMDERAKAIEGDIREIRIEQSTQGTLLREIHTATVPKKE